MTSYPKKNFVTEHPWLARSLMGLMILIVSLIFMRLMLPYILVHSVKSWFDEKQLISNIGEFEIALIDARLDISDISIYAKADEKKKDLFTLDRLTLSWKWQPLLEKSVVVERVVFEKLKTRINLFESGEKQIAGLMLPVSEKSSDSSEKLEQGRDEINPFDFVLRDAVFTQSEVCFKKFGTNSDSLIDYCVATDEMYWRGGLQISPQAKGDTALDASVKGLFGIKGLSIVNAHLERQLLGVDEFRLNDIDVMSEEEGIQLTIRDIDARHISLFQRTVEGKRDGTKTRGLDENTLSIEKLSIGPVSLSRGDGLSLGAISVSNPEAYVLIRSDGKMELEDWQLTAGFEQKPRAKSEDMELQAETSKPLRYSLDKFVLKSDKQFKLIDESLKQAFEVNVHDVAFKLDTLDSANIQTPSVIELTMKLEKHGLLELYIEATPLSKKPDIVGTGRLSGYDLRVFSPLSKQHIGHDIKSGQLDLDMKINVKSGIIDSDVGLVFNHLELRSLNNEEAKRFEADIGFPLNTSLSLLRDRDDSIHLEIPVEGDLEQPNFDPTDVIMTATSKAVTSAVINYYTPFGLVFVAGSLFDLATALHIEPIIFEAGVSKITDENHEQLEKLAKLLGERPAIHITICGYSNREDLGRLSKRDTSVVDDDRSRDAELESESDEKIAELTGLADDRSGAVKQALVERFGVQASRLIECTPEYVYEGISGVEISI